ncbi:Ig-like domain-containing protein [Salinimicrobium xinjiangense]|uniref:Ig-like domain-containing protein n=1 Tax=Salinimicrobium xinjiangense TaxID=438596 RepID=UPI000408DDD5|nr:Ig-like domain-containing protein [Salinimicrobium xinjiangense]
MKKILFLLAAVMILGCSKDDEGGVAPPKQPEVELPVAVDDELSTSENTALTFSGLLDNDTVFDFARITAIDAQTSKGGTVVDNRDGTYTYTPPADFMGEDTFEYTMCDNASPKNCSNATVTVTVTAAAVEAVDDSYESQEDQVLVISNFLANDQFPENGVVSVAGTGETEGTVELQSDGKIKYTPAQGFAGEDSFTYTICNDHETSTCSTATITVTVIDEGSPVAANDEVVMSLGTSSITISSLLNNDTVIDDAEITSVEATGSGSVQLNDDGTVTYTPMVGFTGNDTFTYSLCDDDTPDPTCSTATVTVSVVESVSFSIPANLQDYYSDFFVTTDKDLNLVLISDYTIDAHTTILSYGQRHNYLYDADEDLDNPDNVILMYTGESRYWEEYWSDSNSYSPQTFNTEHIYPQSRLSSADAVTDLHHLRVADSEINSTRLNYPFTEGSGDAKLINGNSWYPGDEWKGDVARMILYLNIRYGETFNKVGNLDLFLKWNAEDPVSAFEIQRNNVIETAQGNRNPFIDNPYLANLIWGGPQAENRW